MKWWFTVTLMSSLDRGMRMLLLRHSFNESQIVFCVSAGLFMIAFLNRRPVLLTWWWKRGEFLARINKKISTTKSFTSEDSARRELQIDCPLELNASLNQLLENKDAIISLWTIYACFASLCCWIMQQILFQRHTSINQNTPSCLLSPLLLFNALITDSCRLDCLCKEKTSRV